MSVTMASEEQEFHSNRDSILLGSTEDLDHSCDPCMMTGSFIEAHGFCKNCQEYLCKDCFECHQKEKVSRNHELQTVDIAECELPDSDEYTEKCPIHDNRDLTYFCKQHTELCCKDCVVNQHNTCDFDCIRDSCSEKGVSIEYWDIMKKLEQSLSDADVVNNKAMAKADRVDSCHDDVLEETAKVRSEINDRLDYHQNEIKREIEERRDNDKKKVQTVLDTCTNVSSDIRTAVSNLQDIKAAGQNRQLFFAIKHAKKKLESDELNRAEKALESTNIHYTFECNKDLQTMLSRSDVLGTLKASVTVTGNIPVTVRTASDIETSCITGCAVLSADKVILADKKNKKLKVLDTQSHNLETEKTLHYEPFDVVLLPNNQIAVTLSEKKEIVIKSSTGRLSTVHKIPVPELCKGITYCQGHLFVICKEPASVLILDKQGKLEKKIKLNNETFKNPRYIVVSKDSKSIYISNYGNNSVVSITEEGDISAIYKHEDLDRPMGMALLHDGSLLVCCYKTVYHISGDLKHGQTVIDGLLETQSICFNEQKSEVYVAIWQNNDLRTFSLK